MSNRDVDDLLLAFVVKELKCDLGKEDATLKDVGSGVLFEVCVKSLRRIDKKYVFNSSMPRNNSSKVAACRKVAESVVECGYREDLGFSSLMYPNEAETRKLLTWLSQNVAADDTSPHELEGNVLFTDLKAVLGAQQNLSWAPSFFPETSGAQCRKMKAIDTVPLSSAVVTAQDDKHKVVYVNDVMPYALDQPEKFSQRICSVLEANAVGLAKDREREKNLRADPRKKRQKKVVFEKMIANSLKIAMSLEHDETDALVTRQTARLSSRFTRQRNQIDTVVVGTEKASELQEKREEELKLLEDEFERIRKEAERIKEAMGELVKAKRRLDAEAGDVQKTAKQLEKERGEIDLVRKLMQDPDGNRARLQKLTNENAAKLLDACKRWEPKRVAMIEAFRAQREKFNERRAGAEALLSEIERFNQQAADIGSKVQGKEERYRQLMAQFKGLQGETAREEYTQRILEIVKNVKKQNTDIEKVLVDTKEMKRDISQITDTLSRSYKVVDEMVFEDAKNDASAKAAYKLLVSMNEKINELVECVNETGQIKNEIMEYEQKVTNLKVTTDTLDIQQVEKDLENLKKENLELAVMPDKKE